MADYSGRYAVADTALSQTSQDDTQADDSFQSAPLLSPCDVESPLDLATQIALAESETAAVEEAGSPNVALSPDKKRKYDACLVGPAQPDVKRSCVPEEKEREGEGQGTGPAVHVEGGPFA